MGYGEAPWVFKGRALYQLQLVKSEEARKHIPDTFKLVECFGYTLGGFYLARYDDSPVGAFEELVVLAGLVWNAPTSCAWASRVYVSNKDARDHGLRSVGLPSRLAAFSLVDGAYGSVARIESGRDGSVRGSWWEQRMPVATGRRSLVIDNVDNARAPSRVADIQLPSAAPPGRWAGPRISLTLPSFSGGTSACPHLLQYSCDLRTNVSVVAAAAALVGARLPRALPPGLAPAAPGARARRSGAGAAEAASGGGAGPSGRTGAGVAADADLLEQVLCGMPVVALSFDDMVMTVEEPRRLEAPAPAAGKGRTVAAAAGQRSGKAGAAVAGVTSSC
ncbi:hypothetical protein FOA52_014981 [Chlamydomonas sp. UWO 241]|nr:hypothetical protein FOA52_014981 [Chlamydomonas sp. UWO 241]